MTILETQIAVEICPTRSSAESAKIIPSARTVSGGPFVGRMVANALKTQTVETVKRDQAVSLAGVGVPVIMPLMRLMMTVLIIP